MDIRSFETSRLINFASDASAAAKLGYGCVFNNKWLFGQWETNFIDQYKPSIKFLELYALCAGLLTWQKSLQNCRIIVHCDNTAVVNMVNNLASSCKRCMHLIRILTLDGLIYNRRVKVVYIKSADNILPDALSRLDFKRFWKTAPYMNPQPDNVHPLMKSAKRLFTTDNEFVLN